MFKIKQGIDIGSSNFVDENKNVLANNVSVAGEIRGPETFVIDPAAVGDNTGTVVIKGDLQVDGTTTTINSTTVTIDDKNIVIASGSADASAANGAGITVDGANATFNYSVSGDKWTANKSVETSNQLISSVVTGTAPLSVQSTTVVTNLNADLLDGQHGSYYAGLVSAETTARTTALGNYLPLSGGTLTGNLQGTGSTFNTLVVNQSSVLTPTTLTDAETVSWAWTTAQSSVLSISGNRTLANPTGAVNGQYAALRVTRTGSFVLSFDTLYKGVSGLAQSTTTGQVDHFVFRYNGTNFELVSFRANVGA